MGHLVQSLLPGHVALRVDVQETAHRALAFQQTLRSVQPALPGGGVTEALGPLQYEEQGEGYLGYGANQRVMMSDETSKLIDSEIRSLVDGAHDRATAILKAEEAKLHLLAQALLEYETLSGDDIRQLLEDGKIDRPDKPAGPALPAAVRGSAIPKAGKRFSGDTAPQGA